MKVFEGRSGCRWLADEAAILVCGIHVDLNQIRAGEADTPEESTYTSAYDRIKARGGGHGSANPAAPSADNWMCELTLQETLDVDVRQFNRTQSTRRASEKGLVPPSLDEYLAMLHWTGRQVRGDETGCIPSHLSSILERLGIHGEFWTELTTKFDRCFGHAVGSSFGRSDACFSSRPTVLPWPSPLRGRLRLDRADSESSALVTHLVLRLVQTALGYESSTLRGRAEPTSLFALFGCWDPCLLPLNPEARSSAFRSLPS